MMMRREERANPIMLVLLAIPIVMVLAVIKVGNAVVSVTRGVEPIEHKVHKPVKVDPLSPRSWRI